MTTPGPCLLLGDGITDDKLLSIARFLPTARDLLCLKLTSKRFAAKIIAALSEGAAAAAKEMLSIADEAGRQWVAGCSEQERGWVLRHHFERFLCLMHRVAVLRLPLVFGRAHGNITLSENAAVATKTAGGAWRAAASKVVMRSGRHFVQIMVIESQTSPMRSYYMMFGWWSGQAGVWKQGRGRIMRTATASWRRTSGAAASAPHTTGRGCRARRSRATASACCSI